MKKDRNCGGSPYPIYPPYPGMNMLPGIPTMPNPTMGMYNPISYSMLNTSTDSNVSNNTIEQQINNLEQQINLLDKRITNLETMYNNNNSVSYNRSQYNS